jgi:hypothetical protein
MAVSLNPLSPTRTQPTPQTQTAGDPPSTPSDKGPVDSFSSTPTEKPTLAGLFGLPDSDAIKKELATKIPKYLQQKFGDMSKPENMKKAFDAYATGPKHEVTQEGVARLLKDAGVDPSNAGWALGPLMDKFDTNKSGGISWSEFQAGMAKLKAGTLA